MHDLDRVMTELNNESFNEYGNDYGEAESSFASEYAGEMLSEADEMTLASELLSVGNEAELEQFLGGLLKKAGSFLKSKTGQALGGMLKAAAKTALPMIGNAIVPGVGGALASAAGDAFGLETEGLSSEDANWETAKGFVRFADAAIKKAAGAHPAVPPQAVAQTALLQAAKQFAPGLLRETGPGPRAGRPGRGRPSSGAVSGPAYGAAPGQAAQGRWIRRGDTIVLLGV
jgi:hypothetical protein